MSTPANAFNFFSLALNQNDESCCIMAVRQSCPHTWKSIVLFWCHEPGNLCAYVWNGTSVRHILFSRELWNFTRRRWMHIWYTIQGCYLLPLRFYQYKKRAWHYFLFDLCYYVTILNFIFIWFLPGNPSLFVACYCLSHGSLASAVITWRNSLVFHDQDKVTSLFVHIYAPLAFTVIRYANTIVMYLFSDSSSFDPHRHFYPDAAERFPALTVLPHLEPVRALLLSGGIC
jgi:hypothetical protein